MGLQPAEGIGPSRGRHAGQQPAWRVSCELLVSRRLTMDEVCMALHVVCRKFHVMNNRLDRCEQLGPGPVDASHVSCCLPNSDVDSTGACARLLSEDTRVTLLCCPDAVAADVAAPATAPPACPPLAAAALPGAPDLLPQARAGSVLPLNPHAPATSAASSTPTVPPPTTSTCEARASWEAVRLRWAVRSSRVCREKQQQQRWRRRNRKS